jgi:hypothetical protein
MKLSSTKLVLPIVAAAFALGLAAPSVESVLGAGPIEPVAGTDAMTPPGLDGAGSLIDAEGFEKVKDLTERISPHLEVGPDGLVSLGDVSASELGVSEKFLADFRSALEYSNRAIAAGDIKVNADLSVELSERSFTRAPKGGDFGYPVTGDQAGIAAAAPPEGEVPQWGAWHYPDGAIFYNTYPDWTYYRNAYFGLCNTMAAYLGYPWISNSLVYFYGYNQFYFGRYCYNPAGVYWYMPYNYCHGGLGYKPAYFWGRVAMYSYHCGCYQYQWAWQGIWARY